MKFLILSTLSLYLLNCFMPVFGNAMNDIEEVCNYNKTTDCLKYSVQCDYAYTKDCDDFFNMYCKEQVIVSDFCYNTGILQKIDKDEEGNATQSITTTTKKTNSASSDEQSNFSSRVSNVANADTSFYLCLLCIFLLLGS